MSSLLISFSVIFFLQRDDEKVTETHVEKLKNFVKLYSVFDNDMDMDGKLSDDEKNIYDMLKKYKLRSYNFILVFILIVTSVFALA